MWSKGLHPENYHITEKQPPCCDIMIQFLQQVYLVIGFTSSQVESSHQEESSLVVKTLPLVLLEILAIVETLSDTAQTPNDSKGGWEGIDKFSDNSVQHVKINNEESVCDVPERRNKDLYFKSDCNTRSNTFRFHSVINDGDVILKQNLSAVVLSGNRLLRERNI